MTNQYKIITKSIVVILWTTMLFSCSKNIEEVHSLYQKNEDIPMSETKNFDLTYTLSGKRALRLTAPIMIDYGNHKDFKYQYFPQSVRIELFNKNTLEKTIVTADRAYIYKDPELSELIGNVHIKGADGSSLQTSHLFWDTVNKHIFGEEETILKQKGEEMRGVGFDSSLDFKNARLNKISGKMKVKQENNI
jgi:LPS export ABC transporter protein LptC